MSSQKDINSVRFFSIEEVFGNKKLVDINNGDFFPFGNDKEVEHTKKLLTNVYENIEVKNGDTQ